MTLGPLAHPWARVLASALATFGASTAASVPGAAQVAPARTLARSVHGMHVLRREIEAVWAQGDHADVDGLCRTLSDCVVRGSERWF